VEIPSPVSGMVKEISVKPGDTVKVGSVLMTFDDVAESGAMAAADTRLGEAVAAAAGPAERPRAPTVGAQLPREGEPARVLGQEGIREREAKPGPQPVSGSVPASPATRRLARELQVNLQQVPGSGPHGLVTAEDVRAFAAVRERPAEVPAPPPAEFAPVAPSALTLPPLPEFERWGPVERVPLRSVRRAAARRLALAWSQIPHVCHQDQADITRLEEFRRRHKAEIEALGGKLTLTVVLLKAVIPALKKHPRFNASLNSTVDEIILKHYYHLGVATDTERGLMVPVLRDVDRKSISELSVELEQLSHRTRAAEVTPEDMQGGTFTITNIGSLGGTGFAPLINYPQVAILGAGRAQLQPVVIGDENSYEIVPRRMLPLVLAFDHRVLDGADAARFLGMVIEVLQDPEEFLLNA
jgi:pyruvate dehydrogenase E2 component (dihydrolipoamide acetyltransferase)